jgi:hypothetical protein
MEPVASRLGWCIGPERRGEQVAGDGTAPVDEQVREQQRAIPAAPMFDGVPTNSHLNWA